MKGEIEEGLKTMFVIKDGTKTLRENQKGIRPLMERGPRLNFAKIIAVFKKFKKKV